ncbi:5-oxoprolinase subunit PxpB [Neptunomonas antarctica]|uniref:Sensor histidine kinase inhibitor, KipI family n=1 Tax=Neptunomonas antarctica TaxID=619304 RepID=A0A1N7J1T3_9GAMM|nr:5-oxoprolinase subunit PxpB [Neptunomonas antarctica]SIS43293.1 sensor histidine kinase inhibitor, KipI family [Neptunomonas antarctica]
MKVEIAGENSLIIYFGETADPKVSAQVQQAAARLEAVMADSLIDMVPSYASLLVIYNPLKTDHYAVRRHIREMLAQLGNATQQEGQVITLPVYYSVESGPDLEALAVRAQLSVEEVISIHSAMEYRVYAIGFAPGFAYLGEVDARIAAPRLSTPRLKVPRGAVAIADRQTAVYPAVSPGGWNLIGLCPTRMFNPDADPTMPVQVGDRVQFSAIDRHEFLALGGEL